MKTQLPGYFYAAAGVLALLGSQELVRPYGMQRIHWAFVPPVTALLTFWVLTYAIWIRQLSQDATLKQGTQTLLPLVAVLLTAVWIPALLSEDLYLYVAYGRQVGIHHSNPYTRTLSSLEHDAVIARINSIWQGQTSFLGPLSLGFFALAVLLSPSIDPLVVGTFLKLFWLVPYALLGRALLTRWRDHPKKLALTAAILGNPLILLLTLVDAHLEVWTLALLALAGLAMKRGRGPEAAALVALTTGFKMPFIILVPICGCWLWVRKRKQAASFSLVYASLYGSLVVLLNGAEWPGVLGYGKVAQSLGFAGLFPRLCLLLGNRQLETIRRVSDGVFYLAIAAICVAILRGKFRAGPFLPMSLAMAALYFTRVYVQPWYTLWFWPLLWLSTDRTDRVLRSMALWTAYALFANLYVQSLTPWVTAAAFGLDLWNLFRKEPQALKESPDRAVPSSD